MGPRLAGILMPTHGGICGGGVNPPPPPSGRPLYAQAITMVPTVKEAGCAAGPVRAAREKRHSLATTAVRSPDHQDLESLHRLRYPGPRTKRRIRYL
jgi:hypothetical protein